MNNLSNKLVSIMSELKAPKSQYNSFGKYNYRKCEDILEAVKPLLKANNCTLTISDIVEQVGDRFYIKAIATITDAESGVSISTTAYAREDESKKGMDGSQVTGASSSYARKYALNGLFAIDDNADSDTTNIEDKTIEKDVASPKKNKDTSKANSTDNEIINYRGVNIKDCNKSKLTVLVKEFELKPNEILTYITKEFGKTKAEELTDKEFKAMEHSIINSNEPPEDMQ